MAQIPTARQRDEDVILAGAHEEEAARQVTAVARFFAMVLGLFVLVSLMLR